MIKFLYLNGYAPIVVCDICQEKIVNAQLGVAIHTKAEKLEKGDMVEVLHLHKGQCHDLAEQKFAKKVNIGWQELMTHLIYLCQNTNIGIDDMKKQSEIDEIKGKFF